MSSISQLEYVIAVDQTRHFGRAAELCHVSQPTLSTQIQKLEDELQVILFDRNKQPILPTEKGRSLIEQARLVVTEHKRLLLMAQKKTDSLEGEFKLAVIPTVAPFLVPRLMQKFNETYPQVLLSIEEMSSLQIIEGLDKDTLDAGILATPLGLSRIFEEPLYYESFFLFVHPNHPFAGLQTVGENMLSQEDLWLPSEEHCLRSQALQLCKLESQGGCYPSIKIKGGSLETILELVENGTGYTLLPQIAADLYQTRHLKGRVVKISRPSPAREVSLVHRRGHLKQAILKAMKLVVDGSLPKSLPREKSKAFRVIGLEGQFQ